ncbi:MAG: hypothetical protein KBA51_01780 [Kiritimatiellae bacterium]|nr:hypothetical protein [Kiritimatiellia bacterium]
MNRATCLSAGLFFAARAWCAEPAAVTAAALPDPVTAVDFFHRGGAQFCRNQMEEAKNTVTEGLARYPEDPALVKLKQLLDQPPQSQPNQDPKNNEDSSESEDQQNNDSQSKPDEQESEENPPQEEPSRETEDSSEQPQDAPQEQPQDGQLTQDQIARLLESASQEEMDLRDVLRRQQPRESPPVDKDW